MTWSLRSVEKGAMSLWQWISEYCSFLSHSLMNNKVWPVSWRANFLHYKWPLLGWSILPRVLLAPDRMQGTLQHGTSVVASQILSLLQICVWWKVRLCENHPASTTQFSSFAERRTVLAVLSESGRHEQFCPFLLCRSSNHSFYPSFALCSYG